MFAFCMVYNNYLFSYIYIGENMKKIILLLICVFLFGCSSKEIKTEINEAKHLSINYPVTNIKALDNEISSYINKIKNEFRRYSSKNSELNISYTYKELNDDIVNVSLQTEIYNDNSTNKIKTFTYDKKTKKFLTMENIISDLNVLDYEIKKHLLEKYSEADIEYLTNLNYDTFSIDDENLRIYFNHNKLNIINNDTIYLDIPLNSLKLLIDIDKTKEDTYLNLKKREVNYDDKVIALTFDDGPSKYTDDILNILKKYDSCATFFVIGNKVDFYDETLIKMLKNGNEIGNHSYTHKYLNRLSDEEFIKEINKTQEEIKKSTGFYPTLFRPTYGGYTDRLKNLTDLTFVLWDVDSRDWKVKNKNKIIDNIMRNVKSGSIVLMHDNHEFTKDAIEDIIKNLKQEGYNFITVSELLELTKLREN